MREIKFRAWDGEKMIYLPLNGTVGEILPIVFDGTSYRLMYLTGQLSKPVEIMQFTGLKDKNGKEIYEGDIVYHTAQRFPLTKDTYIARWVTDGFALRKLDWGNNSLCFNNGITEVLGNIYENPELLQQVK